ncbi:hypothetical protein ACU8KH_03598 [Lachancea thermotolerans]
MLVTKKEQPTETAATFGFAAVEDIYGHSELAVYNKITRRRFIPVYKKSKATK